MMNFTDWIGSRRRWLAVRRTAWRGAIYVLPLAVLFAAATARVAAPDLLDRMSLICFDLYQRAAPRKPEADTPLRIVDIDDDSLKKIGQWPWPRTLVAQLIDRLREAGASVVAFDIDFAEPDRTSPKLLLPLIARNGVGSGEAEKLLAALPDPDQRLAAAMGTVPTVTGFILTNHGDARPPAVKAGFAFAGDDPLGWVDSFPAAVANLPVLEDAAVGNGFLNQYPDWDHVVRRVPLILKLGDKPYPSLPPRRSGSPSARTAMSVAPPVRTVRRILAKRPGDRDPHRPADGTDRCRRAGVVVLRASTARPLGVCGSGSCREFRPCALCRPHRAGRNLGRRRDQ